MYGELLLLIREEACASDAQALADRMLATWPEHEQPPEIQHLRPDQINGSLNGADAVWCYCAGEEGRSGVYDLLEQLEPYHTPMLLTRDPETLSPGSMLQDGVVVGPKNTDPLLLRVILQSLMSQSGLIHQLKQDLTVSQRSQIGLTTQVDKFDTEMQLAAKMQKLFLPKELPAPKGARFSVLFRPAGYVSGDIYDIQQADDEHVSFFVVDAVGHGASAALMTMFVKQSLQLRDHSESGRRAVLPDEALRRVNADIIRRQLETFRFATVCCGCYHLPTRRLMLAHAGHPPPFIFRKNGDIETISLDGPLLGIFEDEPFELRTIQMQPGDRLLMYSDGFEVAFGDPDQPMNANYVQELHALRHGTQQQALAELTLKLDRASGSLNQLDDLTVLIMDATE